jgi:hypothetical protein
MIPSLLRRPDEYFMPEPDDGSWYHQSQLEQQEQEEHARQ